MALSPAEKVAKEKRAIRANSDQPAWGSRRLVRRAVIHPRNTLRKVRESLGLTQRDVTNETGINNATIADVEAGFEVHLATALKLAAFYGRSVEELFLGSPTPAA